MGKANKSGLMRGFGTSEEGFVDLPSKISNIKISRVENGVAAGCSVCFPHGPETVNASVKKNTRSWKKHRNAQHRSK